jgi:hypothetical protein
MDQEFETLCRIEKPPLASKQYDTQSEPVIVAHRTLSVHGWARFHTLFHYNDPQFSILLIFHKIGFTVIDCDRQQLQK